MSVRVLLADDQLPWNDEEKDGLVKSEIIAEIGDRLHDVGAAYEQDKVWFKALIQYLSKRAGYTLILEREYYNAIERVRGKRDFDVAVIDLSWTGDRRLPRGQRRNVGLKLIDEVRSVDSEVPIVVLSQNFGVDHDLTRIVLGRNAFPLQKDYSDADYQALVSTIEFLRFHPHSDVDYRTLFSTIEFLRSQAHSEKAFVAVIEFLLSQALVYSNLDLELPQLRGREEQRPKIPPRSIEPQVVRIFLASSEELKEDRDAFDLYFRTQNDWRSKDGFYLKIVRWENFGDAMSVTRKQDDYNEAIRSCDLFVSLFKTKVGKYTNEEFEIAYEAFSTRHKPKIYTYFEDADIQTDTSLSAFKDRLKELGHFPTQYRGVEHLKLLFSEQLRIFQDGLRPADK